MPEKMTKDDFVLKSGASRLGEAPLYAHYHWRGKEPFDAFTVAYEPVRPKGPVRKVVRWLGKYIGDVDTLEYAAEIANQWIATLAREAPPEDAGFQEVTLNDFTYDVRWGGSHTYIYDPDGPDRATFRLEFHLRGREWRTVLLRNGERIAAYPNVGEALKSLNTALRSLWRRRQVEKAAPSTAPAREASVVHAAKQPLKSFPVNPNDALKGKWVIVSWEHQVLLGSPYSVQRRQGKPREFWIVSAYSGNLGVRSSFADAKAVAEGLQRIHLQWTGGTCATF